MKLYKYLTILFAGSMLMTSCGDDFFNDMDSSTATGEQVSSESKNNPQKVLLSQLNGCYSTWNTSVPSNASGFNAHQEVGFGAIMTVSDIMSNDISLPLGSGDAYHFDHVLDYNGESYIRCAWFWDIFYSIIKSSNEVIQVVNENDMSTEQKHYLGQALAFRGICYAYLAQFYQKTYKGNEDKLCVPIYLTTRENEAGKPNIAGRATVQQVYDQVESDLTKAISYLDGYKRSDKTFIDKQVAEGFLARVYLVMNKWAEAAQMAHDARQGYSLNNMDEATAWNYQDASNKEVMWAFVPTDATKLYYASWASWHSYDSPGYVSVYHQLIDKALYNSIPNNDVRKTLYVSDEEATDAVPAGVSKKFPFVDQWLGNVVYMRASEMYLIEAEASFKAGNTQQTADVMAEFMPNRVANWTAPTSYTAAYIYNQRRIELWGEGFGYFDCLRLKQPLVRDYEGTNENAATQVNIPADSYQWIFQIPKSEIRDNDNITEADQNPVK